MHMVIPLPNAWTARLVNPLHTYFRGITAGYWHRVAAALTRDRLAVYVCDVPSHTRAQRAAE